MDTTWIQVFVLTLSECVAPAGKTVCQQNEIEMQFLTESDCRAVLEQLTTLKDQSENVIVNRQESGCAPSARESKAFDSLEDARAASGGEDWRDPERAGRAPTDQSHAERLKALKSCDETKGRAPCKSGDIIVEGTESGSKVEIWRSKQ